MRISRQWKVFVLSLLLVSSCLVAAGQEPSTTRVEPKSPVTAAAAGAEGLSIEIKLSDRKLSGDGALISQDAFYVIFVNNSERPLEIWNPDFKEGWSGLSFELTDLATGQRHVIRRRPVSDLNRKEFAPTGACQPGERIKLRPDGEYSYPVLLSDCQRSDRDWLGLPKAAYQQRFALKARFESPPGEPRAQNPTWVGTIESPSETVRVVDWQPQPPQYYLQEGFPQKALEILKSDRFWISKRDQESSRTPLQVAAEGDGYPEVVKWLLDNGADVDKASLSGAENAAVIALMLAKHANLSVIDGDSDDTVLQQTARQFSKAKSPEDRRKWQALIEMYKKAGADYDIVTAIRLNDFDRVKAILSKSPQVIHDPDSRSPLREAASEGRLEICRYLIERFHPDVNEFKQGSGYPIIKEALAYPEVVRLLIASGADLKKRMTFQGGRTGAWVVGDNATALHYAAENGVPGTIRLLIDSGVDVFATTDSPFAQLTGNQDQTALDVAAIFGKAENVAAIVHHPKFQRADAKRRKELLDRCLACRRWYDDPFGPPDERWKLLETLLECGADPNARVDGMTAIQRAAQQIWPWTDTDSPRALVRGARIDEIRKEIDVLRKHGAEIDLVSAVASGNEAEVARLLKQDPRLANSRRADGYPALHWAVTMNYEGIVKQLLDAGCDADLRNQCGGIGTIGDTPLHAAACWGRVEIARTLLAHRANVNATSSPNNWTPLHEAVNARRVKVARLLLQNGADPDAKDKNGNRPLDVYNPQSHRKAAIQALFREYGRTAKEAGRR